MQIIATEFAGLLLIKHQLNSDDRGFFYEELNTSKLAFNVVQSNISVSHKNILRGLHYQKGHYAQAKFISVLRGSILQVVIDLRDDSDTYLKHYKHKLSADESTSVLVPRGFANAILSLQDNTMVHYLVDNNYNAKSEAGILYNDPKFNINWECDSPILSDKDRQWQLFADKQN